VTLKNRASSWFLKNLIKPRMEKMDTPGYIIAKIGGKSKLREVMLPEKMIVDIENRLEDQLGQEGMSLLHSTGKLWGWRYADISHFPRASASSGPKLRTFMNLFVRYIESVYADNIEHEIEKQNKSFNLEVENYVVHRKNDKGYLLLTGVWSGLVAWLYSDPSLGCRTYNQNNTSNREIGLRFGPNEQLKDSDHNTRISEDVPGLHKRYRSINKVTDLNHADNSANDLIKQGILECGKDGNIRYGDNRFVIVEATLPYLLDSRIGDREDAKGIVFESAFETGMEIADGENLSFISDYLPAIGYGGVEILKNGKEIRVYSYPWTRFADESSFVLFRGFVSGMVSATKGEKCVYSDYRTDISSGQFELTLKR
jgi:hypothetical protein